MSSTILALPIQPQNSNSCTLIIPNIQIIPIQNNNQQHQIYVDLILRDRILVSTQDNVVNFVDNGDQPTTYPTLSLNLNRLNDFTEFGEKISTALIYLGVQETYHSKVINDLLTQINEYQSLRGQRWLQVVADLGRATVPDTNEWRAVINSMVCEEDDDNKWQEAEQGLVRVEECEGLLMHEKSDCPICMEELLHGDYGDEFERLDVYGAMKLPNCPHVFHWNCICDWLNNSPTCPICRANCLPVN